MGSSAARSMQMKTPGTDEERFKLSDLQLLY